MNAIAYLLLNVTVAATVGGVTNYLAIRMLFRPRRAWRIGRWRVPFTPGIIPKRKAEISAALGDVVADYLVTPEGVRELLGRPDFREATAARVREWLFTELREAGRAARARTEPGGAERFEGEGPTVYDLLCRWAGEARVQAWLAHGLPAAAERLADAVAAAWQANGWGGRPLRDLVPGWNERMPERLADAAAGWALAALRDHLVSLEGRRLLRHLTGALVERAGGWVGLFAGLFVDEDKLASRLTPLLADLLENDRVRAAFAALLAARIGEWGERPLADAVRALAGDDEPAEALRRWLGERIPWSGLVREALRLPVARLAGPDEEAWGRVIDRVAGALLDLLARHADRLLSGIRLRDVVREQVERFPEERLEAVIVSVSGRELRAITWLGALLGSVIGLLQTGFWLISGP
jgi:uncharacterized membrane protein YheB (UPF0754 family)